MDLSIRVADALDEPADLLICSANPYLNLSGGAGGEILRRYGDQMQRELHAYLADHKIRYAQPGTVVPTGPGGTHFRAVLHAVAIDAFYGSSIELIRSTVDRAWTMASELEAQRVAMVALATGYGRVPMRQFGQAIAPLMSANYAPIRTITICVRRDSQRMELEGVIESSPRSP